MIRTLALIVALAPLASPSVAQDAAGDVFVDEGACPFECCQYGTWTARQPTPAFETASRDKQIAVIPAGTQVTAVTGHVTTIGEPFVVHRPHDLYLPGDRLIVYTYQGEGFFTVRFQGEQYTEDLGFSPYGGTPGSRCTESKDCWGTLTGELQSEWWVKVVLPDGRTAWVEGAANFSGTDACG